MLSRRDAALTPAAVGASNLTLELHPNYLRVAVVDARSAQRRLLEEFTLSGPTADGPSLHDVRDVVNGYDLLARNFWHSVRVLLDHQSFTLVPDALFRKEYAVRYLELARGTALVGEKVYFNRHPGWNAVTVFSLPARLDDYLQSVYPFEKLRMFHQVDALLALALEGRPPGGRHLIAFLETGSVCLVYLDAGRLVYANRFAFRTLNDLVYYLLFVLEELSIAPGDLDVHAWGQIEPDDETHRTLREHLPRLHVGDLRSSIALAGPFADISAHRYAGLFRIASLA